MNILIVGLGSIARKHILAIRRNGSHRISALRSGSNPRHKEDGVEDIFSIEEAGDKDFDFAIISNPTSEHAAAIEKLLPLRIPLFIEKPVVADVRSGQALAKKISDAGILTYVGCNLRFLGCLRFLKEYLERHPDRRINEANVYCGSDLRTWRPGTDYRQGYSARPELGGGVNIDLIHDVDYTLWMFGQPEYTRSVCRSSSSLGIEAFDYANFCLVYPGFCASVILNYYRPEYRRSMEIVFDDSVMTIDVAGNTVKDNAGNVLFSSDERIPDTYFAQMNHFIKLVETGTTRCSNDFAAGLSTLRICTNERSR